MSQAHRADCGCTYMGSTFVGCKTWVVIIQRQVAATTDLMKAQDADKARVPLALLELAQKDEQEHVERVKRELGKCE